MAQFELVNKEKHKGLRVSTSYSDELGYGVGAVMVLNTELLAAQRDYAIVFRKHQETGRFFPNVLLGFRPDENLYLDGLGGWRAGHIPLAIAKGPFLLGINGKDKATATTAVDVEDPRVSEGGEGEALIQEDGKPSEYLNYVSQLLLLLHDGAQSVSKMVDLFLELDLIEPLTLDIQFDNGEQLSFQGAYTIPEEKLRELSDENTLKLQRAGFLAAAYYISGSLENVHKLVDWKNQSFIQSQS